MARPPVELVRLETESASEDEEEKRDVSTVFPKEGRNFKADVVQELKDNVQDRFVSESQLSAVRSSDLPVREVNRGKSLAEMLADNKRKKEDAFQDQWKTMKQGKNRPLDAADYAFVNELYDAETRKVREQYDHKREDAVAFRKAQAELPKSGVVKSTVKKPKRKGLTSAVKVVVKKRAPSSKASPSSAKDTPPQDSKGATIEDRHFEESGTAQRHASEATAMEKKERRSGHWVKRSPCRRWIKVEEKGEVVVKASTRERMMTFSVDLETRRRRRQKRENDLQQASEAGLGLAIAQQEAEETSFKRESEEENPAEPVEEEARETDRGLEDHLIPEAADTEQCVRTSVSKRPPLLLDARRMEAIQRKVAPLLVQSQRFLQVVSRALRLSPLCACQHGRDVLDADYTQDCCLNCPLHRNRKRHGQYLKTLLQSLGIL